MATGGHAPGTAQLAATASTRSTPDAGSNTVSSPVSTSIAVSRNARRGHRCDGNRAAITRRRTGAGTVSVASATAPMRRNCWRVLSSESSYGSARAVRNSSVMASTSTPESISGEEAATCRSNSASRVWPLHSWAATAEPADVPTSTSDSVSSAPRPATRPQCPAEHLSPRRFRRSRRRRAPGRVWLSRRNTLPNGLSRPAGCRAVRAGSPAPVCSARRGAAAAGAGRAAPGGG